MKNYIYALLIGLIFGCKIPYQPTLNEPPASYLVIEGEINSSATDSTLIKLTRTVSLSSHNTYVASSIINRSPELYAEVYVEDGAGYSVKLTDIGYGNYTAAPLGLDKTKKYRLRIKTAGKKTYLSDLEPVVPSPPIDSIGFYVKGNGVQVYVNTHDPKNNTRYYRWAFSEAWKFHPAYESGFIVEGDKIVARKPEQIFVKYCWGNNISSEINVSSSVKLAQDVIYQAPITFIDGTSDKLMDRYSIEVKQYALSKDAFLFWSELKRNTESLGSIFDAQPSASRSNVHCLENADETVLGYISVTDIQRKRVFVNKADLHLAVVPSSITNCKLDSQYFCHKPPGTLCREPCPPPYNFLLQPKCGINEVALYLMPFGSEQVPASRFWLGSYDPLITPHDGYMSTKIGCLDCSIRGDIKPPPFWKDN